MRTSYAIFLPERYFWEAYREALAKDAMKHGRSIGSHVSFILREYLDRVAEEEKQK